jgi:hypothetical protein
MTVKIYFKEMTLRTRPAKKKLFDSFSLDHFYKTKKFMSILNIQLISCQTSGWVVWWVGGRTQYDGLLTAIKHF